MITHDARRSLARGNNPVPSPWLATGATPVTSDHARAFPSMALIPVVRHGRPCATEQAFLSLHCADGPGMPALRRAGSPSTSSDRRQRPFVTKSDLTLRVPAQVPAAMRCPVVLVLVAR